MSRLKSHIRFWGRNMLENLGLVLLVSLVVLIFAGVETVPEAGEGFMGTVRSYPYYMMIIGGFLLMIAVAGYFQYYLPLLVSFNCQRKTVILGIMGSMASTIALMLLISILIWAAGGKEIFDFGILPLLTGGLFLENGIGLLFGGIYVKWRKSGMMIFTILAIVCSAGVGAGLAVSRNEALMSFLSSFAHSWLAMGAGILIFLACGFLCIAATKKMEVRG